MSKLYRYGIRGKVLDLLKSYLEDRHQYIHSEGITSRKAKVSTGVPQGSILGPLLFLIHINDLYKATNLKVVNFADDTLLYHQTETCDGLKTYLDKELMQINNWMDSNSLKLNVKKR